SAALPWECLSDWQSRRRTGKKTPDKIAERPGNQMDATLNDANRSLSVVTLHDKTLQKYQDKIRVFAEIARPSTGGKGLPSDPLSREFTDPVHFPGLSAVG